MSGTALQLISLGNGWKFGNTIQICTNLTKKSKRTIFQKLFLKKEDLANKDIWKIYLHL